MSFLNTTASLRHASPLPPGTDRAAAVRQLLQDHEFFVQCGPHSISCARVTPEAEAALAAQADGTYPLPEAVRQAVRQAVAAAAAGTATEGAGASIGTTKAYRVTDVVHTLPAGLWDSKVESTYEMTDLPAGVFVRIRSPLSTVMDTVWTVAEAEGDGEAPGLELVEDITIYCSRLLMGTVRGLCDGGWEKIHAKLIGHLTV